MSGSHRLPVGGTGAVIFGLATVAAAFGGFGTWAALAPLDAASVAHGEVEVEGYHKTVQHRDGGIVKAILVREGDHVAAGQPLLLIDDTSVRARWQQLQSQYWDDLATKARLLAERDGAGRVDFAQVMPSSNYPRLAEVERAQVNLFNARRQLLAGQVAVLRKRILQFDREGEALAVEQHSKERQLALIQNQVGTVEDLLKKGLALKPRLQGLQADSARLQGERDDFGARIAQVQQGVASTELEIANVSYRHLDEVATNLREVEGDIRKVEQEMTAVGDALARMVVRAPQDGVVVGLRVHTVGAVVGSGDDILDVVPQGESLVVEARVPPGDIDRVVVGRQAQVRFLTFLPGLTPPASGKVIRISADLYHDDRTGQPYYLARVGLDPDSLAKLPGPLTPGMQADVLITTGRRTALEYFIDPLARAMTVAMREK